MKAEDVKRTIKKAIEKAQIKTKQKPKLLSDNGPCYVSNELKDYLKNTQKMKHVRGKPLHLKRKEKLNVIIEQ